MSKELKRLHQIISDDYGVGYLRAKPETVGWAVEALAKEVGGKKAEQALSEHNQLREKKGQPLVYLPYGLKLGSVAEELVDIAKLLQASRATTKAEEIFVEISGWGDIALEFLNDKGVGVELGGRSDPKAESIAKKELSDRGEYKKMKDKGLVFVKI